MRKRTLKYRAFTIVELLLSVALLAMLMTAVAFAFDASMKNYKSNVDIYKTVSTGRQALLRIVNDVRTAQGVAHIGTGGDPDNQQLSLVTAGGQNITYRFDSDARILYYRKNSSAEDYVLCCDVANCAFNRALVPGTTTNAVRSVRMTLTVTDDAGGLNKMLAAGSLVRKNL
ncbi:MAG: prepilin-type N-terminal cleavage/methylation domain-containing protein [Planctomycetaceae bacterium]|nr:prepilin-type N-terminal cleavage/methylation domain-containing protein [Planctomycetaceae bacterium]